MTFSPHRKGVSKVAASASSRASRTAGAAGTDNTIVIDRVSRVFGEEDGAQRVVALDDVSLRIDGGEFVAIVGASGCGKTTLLRILAGLEQATSGSITIGGRGIPQASENVGFVFQHAVLLPWMTVLENVLLPVQVRGLQRADFVDRARELLGRSGIGEFADHRPAQLSGGMRQRAAICRALLLEPEVLLMDEPFGALDAMTRDSMNEDLFSLWRSTKKSIVLVTHSITEAVSLATKVVVMSPRPGRIVASHEFNLNPEGDFFERTFTPEYSAAVATLKSYFSSAHKTAVG